MFKKRCVIIGSGASIRQGDWKTPTKDLYVWNKLKDEITIGINWCFKYFVPTISLYSDYQFYYTEKEALSKLPLVVSLQDAYYSRAFSPPRRWQEIFHLHDNIYLLPNRKPEIIDGKKKYYFGKEAWRKGFYSKKLSGYFALNLAIALGFNEIYLLGYDCGAVDGRTHFYQGDKNIGITKFEGIKKTGVGFDKKGRFKTSKYENKSYHEEMECFKKHIDDIEIYNVSLKSKINIFQKISYKTLYTKLNLPNYINQNEERKKVLNIMEKHYA